ncbi:MAG TPA: PHP-associated domain-containing protein [Vicinamibacterales bacterium]|nr:PHP-associated domain-containing protein [Vicinamibacterales bacterium]
MIAPRAVSALLFASAVVAGTIADRPLVRRVRVIGEYRVLAVDFHTHSSMWSDGALTPWGLVLEARRAGLDAIAITGHNEVLDARIGRRFSRTIGGPTVLVGEEVLSAPQYHLIAVGISERVSFQQRAAGAIDEVHRQGGIAIAAHPMPEFWAGWDADAMKRLDGAEICHPLIYPIDHAQADFERFAARGSVAAIGSSDFHGLGPMGACRTFVFASHDSPSAIIDAVRAHRTVVYGRDGRAYGDPSLIPLAERAHLVDAADAWRDRGSILEWWSRLAGVAGLAGIVTFGPRRRSRRQQAA